MALVSAPSAAWRSQAAAVHFFAPGGDIAAGQSLKGGTRTAEC